MLRRREFLNFGTQGLGATAFASLLHGEGTGISSSAPKAKRAINICLVGGFSQIDTFDYKPALERYHGKRPSADLKLESFFGKVGMLRKNDWRFRQRGQSGLWVSDLFPHIAGIADELTVIRSMYSDTGNHTPALFMSNTGFQTNGFPSLGSWLSYGLGSISESLPAFVVIPDRRGAPSGGASSWGSGFLPAQHQGVQLRSEGDAVRDLFPPSPVSAELAGDTQALREHMHRNQVERVGAAHPLLQARLRSYELAARMQLSVPELTDIAGERAAIRQMYGLGKKETDDFGRSCLMARRMLERGVRFVQLYSGRAARGRPTHQLGRT